MKLLHGTAVAIRGNGVLLTGPTGSGKSDMAFRLMALGTPLVADDQIILWASGGQLFGRSPDTTAGLMEVRGVGIEAMPYVRYARICLQVELLKAKAVKRMPDQSETEIDGVQIQYLRLPSFDPSTPLKVKAALKKGAMP